MTAKEAEHCDKPLASSTSRRIRLHDEDEVTTTSRDVTVKISNVVSSCVLV